MPGRKSPASDRSFVDLLEEDWINAFYGSPIITVMVAVGLPFALFTAPAWVPQFWPLSLVALVALAAIVLLLARRVWTLRRLCDIGVEVEADLTDLSDIYGETDFRTATYRYECSGEVHDFKVTGADFFMSRASRHGEHVLLLVDPRQPKRATFLRTSDFGLEKRD
jgi:uncharacterized protein DUF3592